MTLEEQYKREWSGYVEARTAASHKNYDVNKVVGLRDFMLLDEVMSKISAGRSDMSSLLRHETGRVREITSRRWQGQTDNVSGQRPAMEGRLDERVSSVNIVPRHHFDLERVPRYDSKDIAQEFQSITPTSVDKHSPTSNSAYPSQEAHSSSDSAVIPPEVVSLSPRSAVLSESVGDATPHRPLPSPEILEMEEIKENSVLVGQGLSEQGQELCDRTIQRRQSDFDLSLLSSKGFTAESNGGPGGDGICGSSLRGRKETPTASVVTLAKDYLAGVSSTPSHSHSKQTSCTDPNRDRCSKGQANSSPARPKGVTDVKDQKSQGPPCGWSIHKASGLSTDRPPYIDMYIDMSISRSPQCQEHTRVREQRKRTERTRTTLLEEPNHGKCHCNGNHPNLGLSLDIESGSRSLATDARGPTSNMSGCPTSASSSGLQVKDVSVHLDISSNVPLAPSMASGDTVGMGDGNSKDVGDPDGCCKARHRFSGEEVEETWASQCAWSRGGGGNSLGGHKELPGERDKGGEKDPIATLIPHGDLSVDSNLVDLGCELGFDHDDRESTSPPRDRRALSRDSASLTGSTGKMGQEGGNRICENEQEALNKENKDNQGNWSPEEGVEQVSAQSEHVMDLNTTALDWDGTGAKEEAEDDISGTRTSDQRVLEGVFSPSSSNSSRTTVDSRGVDSPEVLWQGGHLDLGANDGSPLVSSGWGQPVLVEDVENSFSFGQEVSGAGVDGERLLVSPVLRPCIIGMEKNSVTLSPLKLHNSPAAVERDQDDCMEGTRMSPPALCEKGCNIKKGGIGGNEGVFPGGGATAQPEAVAASVKMERPLNDIRSNCSRHSFRNSSSDSEFAREQLPSPISSPAGHSTVQGATAVEKKVTPHRETTGQAHGFQDLGMVGKKQVEGEGKTCGRSPREVKMKKENVNQHGQGPHEVHSGFYRPLQARGGNGAYFLQTSHLK